VTTAAPPRPPAADSQRPLWFLHGFGADRLSWLATTPALQDLPVHTPDLPGHGRAGTDIGDGTPEALAERLSTAIAGAGTRPVHLVGHSLGGGVALLIARERPDLVASLFLIAPAGLGAGVDPGFLRAYPTLADEDAAFAMLRRLVTKPQFISAQTVAYALDQLNRGGARQALSRVAEQLIAAHARLCAVADEIADSAVPRMVVWGAEDRINPLDAARLAAFGDHAILPAAGHLAHIEMPGEINAQLRTFLDERARDD